MKKKIIIIVSLLIVLVIGITYAWWNWQSSTNTNVTFNVEGASVTYSAGNNISGIKLIPVSSKEKGVTDNTAAYKEITASSNKTMYLTLNMALTTFPSNLADASLVWEIYKGNTKIGNGNFSGKQQGNSITLFKNQEINSTESLYKLYIWIDGTQSNPNTMMNQDFVFTLNATATDEEIKSALPNFILNSNAPVDSINSTYVQNTTPGIDFKNIASDTNGKGLYIRSGTENDLNPIYYYRGAVDNNNVYFANYCWKIVRTTDTGGLKMIYNGEASDGTCGGYFPTIYGDEDDGVRYNLYSDGSYYTAGYLDGETADKYVGYTFDNNGVENDSFIKSVIDYWYEQKLLDNYNSYIEDTIYCNDKSIYFGTDLNNQVYQYFNGNTYRIYDATNRFLNGTPSLNCNNNDSYTVSNTLGNGKLKYPVGLITLDEIILAGEDGSKDTTANNNYYLYGQMEVWTMTPAYISSNYLSEMFVISSYYRGPWINYVNNDSQSYVRTVISLKPEYNSFTYGNGTTTNPYRFDETMPN